jgi:hypothetical protein
MTVKKMQQSLDSFWDSDRHLLICLCEKSYFETGFADRGLTLANWA